jgi:Spy/CpxP family protein refolding chaperone
MKSYKPFMFIALATLAMVFVSSEVIAQQQQPGARQQPGGQRPGGGFGGFGGRGRSVGLSTLIGIKEVRTEIEMVEDQNTELTAALTKIREEARSQQGERPDFRNLSQEDREKLFAQFRERGEKQRKAIDEKINEILLPHQVDRLKEIALQIEGNRALMRDEVAKELKITAEQKEKMEKVQADARTKMQAEIREIFQSGDREKIREAIETMTKQTDTDTLAVLTTAQKTQFTKMKGKEFKLPEGALRGGRGGGRPGGGQRPGGGRPGGGQPGQRPGGDRPPQRPTT